VRVGVAPIKEAIDNICTIAVEHIKSFRRNGVPEVEEKGIKLGGVHILVMRDEGAVGLRPPADNSSLIHISSNNRPPTSSSGHKLGPPAGPIPIPVQREIWPIFGADVPFNTRLKAREGEINSGIGQQANLPQGEM